MARKTVVAQTPTLGNSVESIVNRFSQEKARLERKKTDAVSAFRQTAVDLDNINTELRGMSSNYQELMTFIKQEQEVLDKEVADNDAVRQRILDLIGE